jgi:hypothetical protein
MHEVWDLWFPSAGATGVSFARCRVDPKAAGDRVLVHAAPPVLNVTVRDQNGSVVASGDELERKQEGPMSYLLRDGDEVTLEDVWPTEDDIGRVVLLPGGEAGVLLSWWNADDRSAWRWQVEFSNQR